jgi:signal peptidase II
MAKVIKANGRLFLIISLLWVILDQFTKYLVVKEIDYYSSGIEITPFFNIVHVYNKGAAFSFLASMGGWQRWFFVGVAVIITLVLLVLLLKTPKSKPWTCLAISLIIGGAVGNLIDRVVLGHVVDFLLFYIKTDSGIWAYPAFNVADIGVCVGAALLVIISIFGKDEKEQ